MLPAHVMMLTDLMCNPTFMREACDYIMYPSMVLLRFWTLFARIIPL